MNGAESLVRTLVNGGVDTCFANPGTSEMHFVSALDRVEGMRCVLGLFEGVVTGAADGYWRIKGTPAATLLHVGSGLANGLANLHNARKARSAIVNVVGNHATYHQQYDTPLSADVEAVARPMSDWVRSSTSSRSVAADGAAALEKAREAPGNIATLILPANTAWEEADGAVVPAAVAPRRQVSQEDVKAAAAALRTGANATLYLGGVAVREKALEWAGRIAAKTGCRLAAEYQNPLLQRGAGRVQVERAPYGVDAGVAMFAQTRQLVLAGAKIPVAFFAYPGKPSVLVPESCHVSKLGTAADDLEAALRAVAEELDAINLAPAHVARLAPPAPATGAVTLDAIAQTVGALIPENAIVIDEAVSTGRGFATMTSESKPHDWICSMGGSIGYGLPHAIGTAIAAPDRKTVLLQADGSAMYTPQALWTMAREGLNILIVLFNNKGYKVLINELANVGGGKPGGNALNMLTVDGPGLDWLQIARGQGVEAGRATDMDAFAREIRRGLAVKGPYLVELVI